jgi:2-iminobutanoate/2-iminopropanoate deaminase
MKTVIKTSDAPGAVGPYSQGIVTGNLLFTAGQVSINPETGIIIQDSIENEVKQIMMNLTAIAKAANTSLENVVKTTIFLTDMDDFVEVNKIYGSYFINEPPARSTVEVSKLPVGARVEIEMIIEIL